MTKLTIIKLFQFYLELDAELQFHLLFLLIEISFPVLSQFRP